MYINVSIDMLYKKFTSMIAYSAAVAKARKEFRVVRKFYTGSYII